MEKKSIGQFISALRKANGMTQKQLADELNISDKTVSRWERDEGYPDISLIPVIADIFGVTCDELLCGERKPKNENAEAEEAALSVKGEKQRRRIISGGLTQYKNRSLISIGIMLAGLIVAVICRSAHIYGRVAFEVSLIFFIAAVICQIIFTNKALLFVGDDAFSETETADFKKSIALMARKVFITVLTIEVIAAPTVFILFGGNYLPLGAFVWFILSVFIIALVEFFIISAVDRYLIKKGILPPAEKKRKIHKK